MHIVSPPQPTHVLPFGCSRGTVPILWYGHLNPICNANTNTNPNHTNHNTTLKWQNSPVSDEAHKVLTTWIFDYFDVTNMPAYRSLWQAVSHSLTACQCSLVLSLVCLCAEWRLGVHRSPGRKKCQSFSKSDEYFEWWTFISYHARQVFLHSSARNETVILGMIHLFVYVDVSYDNLT